MPPGDPAHAPVGPGRGEVPSHEELQLAVIASDPVIELDPVESGDEVEEEAPLLAELDRDDESESSTELDAAPDVIFPPAVEAHKRRIAPPARGPNRAFLLAGVAVTAVALVGVLAGFLISYSRPVNGAPAPTHVNNTDLEQIATLTALENLTLSGTQVSDRGMVSLKKLPNLRKLDLSRTIVTDPGLLELQGLGQLKELVLVGSLANGAALKAVLPHLKVRD
jgi:hypothetical protein